MIIPPKAIYGSIVIPIKMPKMIVSDLEQNEPQIHMEPQETPNSENNPKQ